MAPINSNLLASGLPAAIYGDFQFIRGNPLLFSIKANRHGEQNSGIVQEVTTPGLRQHGIYYSMIVHCDVFTVPESV